MKVIARNQEFSVILNLNITINTPVIYFPHRDEFTINNSKFCRDLKENSYMSLKKLKII